MRKTIGETINTYPLAVTTFGDLFTFIDTYFWLGRVSGKTVNAR